MPITYINIRKSKTNKKKNHSDFDDNDHVNLQSIYGVPGFEYYNKHSNKDYCNSWNSNYANSYLSKIGY